jgi:hypothetical protein
MADVTFTPDHRGVGDLLNSDGMRDAMDAHGQEIRMRAETIAPVYTGRGAHHPGRYKASFHVRSHLHGGATNDRAEAVVYNNAPEAFYVEFGHWGAEPEHIMARAAFVPVRR